MEVAPPRASASSGSRACPSRGCRPRSTRSPRAISASTRFEPMNPAPPVTRQSPKTRASQLCQNEPGPCHTYARHGPDRRTTLVGLGAVRDPRERGRCSRARSTSLSRTAYRCGPDRRELILDQQRNLRRPRTFPLKRRSGSSVDGRRPRLQRFLRRAALTFVSVSDQRGIQTPDHAPRRLRPAPLQPDRPPQTVDVLGVPLALTDYERTLDWIDAMVAQRQRGYVCVCNVHTVMASGEDPELRAALTPPRSTSPTDSRWCGRSTRSATR